MSGPLRDSQDPGDVSQVLDSIELDDHASSSHEEMLAIAQDTPILHADLERQVTNKRSSRRCNLDKWVKICVITKNSFCSLLAAGLCCLVIALVVLVLMNTPRINEIFKKAAQIADGLGPH